MNNQQQPQTIRAASEKQTAFIAALFQSIDWKAVTMQEASATIRGLLKVRDAHKPAKPAKEKKADKKKASKEKENTTTNTNDGKAIKAETITNDVKPAPEAPKAPETASAETMKAPRKGKKGETVYIAFLWQGKRCKIPADVVQDLGDGLAYVVHQDLERKEGAIIDVASGLNVISESTKAKTFQKWEEGKAAFLPKIHETRKGKTYKHRVQELETLPVAHDFIEEAAKRAAERAAKRAEQGKKTLSVHHIDGQDVALKVRLVKDLGDGVELVRWLASDHHYVYSAQDKATGLGIITGGESYVLQSWEADGAEIKERLRGLREKPGYKKTLEELKNCPVQDVQPEKMLPSYNSTFNALFDAEYRKACKEARAQAQA